MLGTSNGCAVDDDDDDGYDDVAATDAAALIITRLHTYTHTQSPLNNGHTHTLTTGICIRSRAAERYANITTERAKVYSMTDRIGDAAATGPPQSRVPC